MTRTARKSLLARCRGPSRQGLLKRFDELLGDRRDDGNGDRITELMVHARATDGNLERIREPLNPLALHLGEHPKARRPALDERSRDALYLVIRGAESLHRAVTEIDMRIGVVVPADDLGMSVVLLPHVHVLQMLGNRELRLVVLLGERAAGNLLIRLKIVLDVTVAAGRGRLRKPEDSIEIAPEADEERPSAVLGNAVVGRVENGIRRVVAEFAAKRIHDNLDRVAVVVRLKPGNILEEECEGPFLGDDVPHIEKERPLRRMREALSLSDRAERLAREAPAKNVKVRDRLRVDLRDVPVNLLAGPVRRICRLRVLVPFRREDALAALRRLEAEPDSSDAGEEVDELELAALRGPVCLVCWHVSLVPSVYDAILPNSRS